MRTIARGCGRLLIVGFCWIIAGELLHAEWWGNPRPMLLAQWRRQAEHFQAIGQWDKASEFWERIVIEDRQLVEAKQQYQFCLRRAHQVQRYLDRTYQKQIESLSLPDALKVYAEILAKVQSLYVDKDKSEIAALFKEGIEEFRMALADEVFTGQYLSGLENRRISDFQSELLAKRGALSPRRAADAQSVVQEIALAAEKSLGLKAALVVLEFSCGACSGLDEHSCYLTPGEFQELNETWRGEHCGVGIEIVIDGGRLVVAHVDSGSPAEAMGIRPGDRLARIGNKPAGELSLNTARDEMRGETGSILAVEVIGADMQPRQISMKRRMIRLASVSDPRFLDERLGIGYLQIRTFQESTTQELNAAIAKMQSSGLKVLLLDLRGNHGGLFDVAVQVADRFLSEGVIVYTHGQVREYNNSFQAAGANVCDVPVVLLVDGTTASAAEMIAGAFRDHQRGTLVGQTTFGKGTIQKVRKLSSTPAAIRLTVARFYSPRGLPISGAGVSPHLKVPGGELPLPIEQDTQLQTALDVARPLAMSR